jgi:hypothetical protein
MRRLGSIIEDHDLAARGVFVVGGSISLMRGSVYLKDDLAHGDYLTLADQHLPGMPTC